MNALWVLTGLAVILVAMKLFSGAKADPAAAKQAMAAGAALVDVRSPSEHAGGHLPGSLNIPVDRLPAGLDAKVVPKDRPVLVYCASGMRSARAAGLLRQAGWTNVLDLGGIGAARAALG